MFFRNTCTSCAKLASRILRGGPSPIDVIRRTSRLASSHDDFKSSMGSIATSNASPGGYVAKRSRTPTSLSTNRMGDNMNVHPPELRNIHLALRYLDDQAMKEPTNTYKICAAMAICFQTSGLGYRMSYWCSRNLVPWALLANHGSP